MSDEEIEGLYDITYDMSLNAFLMLDYVDEKGDIEKLRDLERSKRHGGTHSK